VGERVRVQYSCEARDLGIRVSGLGLGLRLEGVGLGLGDLSRLVIGSELDLGVTFLWARG
jgi:hypothetical protein